jgi:protein ImuA
MTDSCEKPLNLADLRHRLRVLEGLAPTQDLAPIRFGVPAIDEALPWGGLARGSLHEISSREADAAAHGFVVALLARIIGCGSLLWCRLKRASHEFGLPYGPGFGRFGLSCERILFVEAKQSSDVLWAMEEGLRAKGLSAVFGEGIAADLTAARRLQLAAETGGKTALLLTPPGKRSPISAAATRWRVMALPSSADDGEPKARWQAELVRCRGGNPNVWIVDWNHEALRFDLAAPLADRLLAATAN